MTVIRVNYYEPKRLPLVNGPIKKAYDKLCAEAPDARVFFRSGWLHGPHLNLYILGEGVAPELVSEQAAAIRAWIDENPSNAQLSEDAYLTMARKLGNLEGIEGPYLPFEKDNSIHQTEYRSPRLVDGHEALQPAYEAFLSRTAGLLFRLAKIKEHNNPVATMVLIALFARAADRFEPDGISRGYISLRAHADFFFANFDQGGQIKSRFDTMAERWQPQLFDAIGPASHISDDSTEQTEIAAIIEDWMAVLDEIQLAIKQVSAQDNSWFSYTPDSFPEEHDEALMPAFEEAGLNHKVALGATLERVLDVVDPDESARFFGSQNFQVFRIILNMFYSMLPAINVSPAERFGMCHMVATSVENGARRG